MDFGYAVSENAFVALAVDLKTYTMWIFDEMYENGMTNLDIAKRITEMGYSKEMIWADAAEPKSIYELQQGFMDEKDGEYTRFALPNIRPALKGPDSVNNGIARMQQFHIIVHPRCVNTLRELSTYHWDVDKDGNFTGKPCKEDDHVMDAARYALSAFFMRGHGYVAEARGEEMPATPIVGAPAPASASSSAPRKYRRVFAT